MTQFDRTIYLKEYNIIRMKRCLFQSGMIFAFQYLSIATLPFTFPNIPIYPPMGIAFSMFSIFGFQSIIGLFLGGLLGYLLKGLSPISTLLYLSADIFAGLLGSYLCLRVFSRDVKPFENSKELIKFIAINAFITCLISSIFRMIASILNENQSISSIPVEILFFHFIDLWLSDLNAILIFSSLIITLATLPLSREKIIQKSLVKPIILFIFSILYLIYFIINGQNIYQMIGVELYTFVPFALFLCCFFTLILV